MWQDIFDLQVSAGEKVLRAILICVFLIAVLRIVGKRELGQTNTLDLVVLLLVANAVQNGIIGMTSRSPAPSSARQHSSRSTSS